MSGSMRWAVYYHGRNFGIDWSTVDLTREACEIEAMSCEDKYAPAEVVQIEVHLYAPGHTYYYRGESHTWDQAMTDGMLE